MACTKSNIPFIYIYNLILWSPSIQNKDGNRTKTCCSICVLLFALTTLSTIVFWLWSSQISSTCLLVDRMALQGLILPLTTTIRLANLWTELIFFTFLSLLVVVLILQTKCCYHSSPQIGMFHCFKHFCLVCHLHEIALCTAKYQFALLKHLRADCSPIFHHWQINQHINCKTYLSISAWTNKVLTSFEHIISIQLENAEQSIFKC